MSTTDVHGVTISAEVIDRTELTARLDGARAHVAAHQIHGVHGTASSAAERAGRLHALWATVAPPTIASAAGARAQIGFNVKRVVRKVGAWYVEPRFQAQREIDAEIARFASDSVAAIERLEHEVERLQVSNARLQREMRTTRRDQRGDA